MCDKNCVAARSMQIGLLCFSCAASSVVAAGNDWLLDPTPYKAEIREENGSVVLDNGLVRRELLLRPGVATFSLRNLVSGEEHVRTTAPEAYVTIDGTSHPIGGLEGAPIDNYLKRDWIGDLLPVAGSYRLKSWCVTNVAERLTWKKRPEWLAEDLPWPPKGRRLEIVFSPPADDGASDQGEVVLEEPMTRPWDAAWREVLSSTTDRTSCRNEGKYGEIYNRVGTYAYLEHDWPADAVSVEAVVSTEADADCYCWGPAVALFFRNPSGGRDWRIAVFPRAASGEYEVESETAGQFVGKFDPLKPARVELLRRGDGWLARMSQRGGETATYPIPAPASGARPYKVAVGKLGHQRRGLLLPPNVDRKHCPNPPGPWIETRIHEIVIRKAPVARPAAAAARGTSGQADLPEVTVNYEIYDGAPLIGKSVTVRNTTTRPVRVEGFVEENLKLVERSYAGLERGPTEFNFYVESNYYLNMMVGGHSDANLTARYLADPGYATQVDFRRTNPSVLKVGSDVGPDQVVHPGGTFETPYAWMLFFDSTDRQRRQLALRRYYRILAPWTAENPLLFHNTDTSVENTRRVIGQCAEVGFDICAQSFRSGFDLESTNAVYRATYAALGREAKAKGVAFGAYALTSCRVADKPENMVVDPHPDYGLAPCLASSWGANFVQNVGDFLCEAEMGFFENDGPYAHGCCSATNHLHHVGYGDSQYAQWKMQASLYRRCRANGIYVNQPAWYFLEGGSATTVGYLEQHWSRSHEEQELLERADIWDGCWNRPLTMCWGFIPLDVYHGGGARACYEPLKENLADLDRRMANTIGCGLKCILRGHRLYDSPEVKEMLMKWTAFRRRHRAVLDGDFIRLRRADGRDWDGWIMANAQAKDEKAIAFLFNPLSEPLVRRIRFPLYYAGRPDAEKDVEIPARGYAIIPFRGENRK